MIATVTLTMTMDNDNDNNSANDSRILKGHPLIETIPITLQLPTRRNMQMIIPSSEAADPGASTSTDASTDANANTEPQSRPQSEQSQSRELKIGMLCGGNDVLAPELCRHLARSGAQMIMVSASLKRARVGAGGSAGASGGASGGGSVGASTLCRERNIMSHIIPTRAMENGLPLMVSNYVGPTSTKSAAEQDEHENENDDDDDEHEDEHQDYDNYNYNNDSANKKNSASDCFIGSSAIITGAGEYLACAPDTVYGDMPCDEGYLLPCESGALYAADIDIDIDIGSGSNIGMDGGRNSHSHSDTIIKTSIEQWDLQPRIDNDGTCTYTTVTAEERSINKKNGSRRESTGFGKEVQNMIGRNMNSRKRKRKK